MSNLTEKALVYSLRKLLNEKPLKQITVKDIVAECGVNRNTFYYHFHDIPNLLEHMLKEDIDKIIESESQVESLEDLLSTISVFVRENKKAALHIYRSVNRDIFEKYQWAICDYAVSLYLAPLVKDVNINETDYKVILAYIKSLTFGFTMGWLEEGLKDDIEPLIHRICQLKQGDLEALIEKCKMES